ncbi:UDP-N-acetylmuramoyl-L-alanyl-D-glutamate--2,6-diaminopimelate ligase [Alicyclobacillus fastidiosus]|uniref:UDP-N-acetylmuramoyl-L-alanyl-D-glutamate--2,6-diaminopimelate ligase n=1 Tax=Alicyclobacillus fastidiosus TaxID=392011 RepID=A0ABY6ZC50_9BACL|nr:UDP-N-acetylmuramoyl-L-alanyl-D-glutamate--2,6-diaminopimelate ligase [Alicyclobacillus fastidiosus]WAH40441.1 UDP-N-acetylmuramoyl-L-alanyl-D-glutamate--2,6-diaminopimelate ligase [Alicyclobacillus fastidiosus]
MRLKQLVQPLLSYEIRGNEDVDVETIESDSRRVGPGALFVAVPGFTVDGHAFAGQAVAAGAVALLVERHLPELDVPQVIVNDSLRTSAVLADILYRHPSQALRMVGVTGTNGKTTVTHIIRHILEFARRSTGLLGTVGGVIGGRSFPVANTTPHAVEVHGFLKQMVDAGCTYGVMEVSSHALVERRVAGVDYDVAVFTNLSQDHLDFHGTMDAYAQAKSLLFARLGNTYGEKRRDSKFAVVNIDDAYAPVMMGASVATTLTYGLAETADVRASDVVLTHLGATMNVTTPFGTFPVTTGLIGRFNVYNVLAAIAVAVVEEIPVATLQAALSSYEGVPGRCERVDEGQPFGIFVDYAHTPDGLENVLSSVREFAAGRVICVVGCGGDRDKTKRPLMASAALSLSDAAIFTSDNPRTEDPERILDDMEAGLPAGSQYRRIVDRGEAIKVAIQEARENDVVVIAGKGHEDYQIVGRTKIHFDDKEEARKAVRARLSDNSF